MSPRETEKESKIVNRHAGLAVRDAEKPWEMQGRGGRVGLAARHAKIVSRHAGFAARDAETTCLEPNY